MKIGTDCVLKTPGTASFEEFKSLDENTTSLAYGFRVTGYCLFQDNKVQGYLCEDFEYTKTYEQVKAVFIHMMTSPKGNRLDPAICSRLIMKIKELRDFIAEKSLCVIKGSSLFFTFARDYFEDWQNYD